MKLKISALVALLIFTLNPVAILNCQQNEIGRPHPKDLFSEYPDIDWESTLKKTVNILEQNNIQPVNTIPTELAWDGRFNGINGRTSVYFQKDILSGYTILLYTQNETEETADEYKLVMSDIYGEPTSDYNTGEFNIVTWKSGKDYLIKLQKSNNVKSPLVIVSWIKQSKLY